MAYDNKIIKNIETIEKYLKILDDFEVDSLEDFETNVKDYLAISMSCFTLLNAVIEIGENLIDMKKLEIPSTYKEIFSILRKSKVLSYDLALELEKYMYQRNMLAHNYDSIDVSKIYELYIKRDVFKKFLYEIKNITFK